MYQKNLATLVVVINLKDAGLAPASMLRSQFSVIFAYFRRKNGVFSKNNVMIKFLEKKLAVV
jgi:hypothetical protein